MKPTLYNVYDYDPSKLNICLAEIPYEVTVWTGTERGAGTDANVFIQMYGEYGKSEEFQLRNRTDNFEQGQMDKFKVSMSRSHQPSTCTIYVTREFLF